MTRWLLRLLVLAGLAFIAWKVWELMDEGEDHSEEWAARPRPRAQATAQGATAPTAVAPARDAAPPATAPAAAPRATAPTPSSTTVAPARAAAPAPAAPAPAAPAPAAPAPAAPDAAARPAAAPAPSRNGGPQDGGTPTKTTWVKPVGSTCPPGYPVKAKTGSRVFRVPGMFSYQESKPERCYCDEDAAVADGFTRAKR